MSRIEAPETLILTRRDVRALMTPGDYLEAVETGFRAAAMGKAQAPPPMTVHGVGGAYHAKGASLHLDRPYVALKFNGNFPGNPEQGLPTIQGAILLCDGSSGSLLAVIDSIEITIRRTAAASALAARHLARPESRTIFISGCGEQGEAHVAALKEVLPLRHCLLWDRDEGRARALAARLSDPSGMEVEIADTLSAAAECDAIVTCTTAREPYLTELHVRPGTFIAAVGADSPDKNEVAPELMRKATVVADVLEQVVVMGDLRHALEAGAMRIEDVHAELSEIVLGTKSGRAAKDEITLFDSTGTALQDVASAAMLFNRAVAQPGIHTVELGRG